MEQIVAKNVQAGSNSHDLPPGIADVRYLTMEHREVGGKTESHADLMFASERQGVASWLAAPASMGSLEFVSPDASMVTSAVIKNPRSIMEEIFKMIGGGDADFTEHLAEFESKTGVSVLNDIAAPLGGEVTMAFDGPVIADAALEADFRGVRSGDAAGDDRQSWSTASTGRPRPTRTGTRCN